MSLKALIAKKYAADPATAIPATRATEEKESIGTVATVATVAVAPVEDATPALAGIAFAEPVRCADCVHFQPGINPLRGRCGAGVTLAAPLAWHQRGQKVAVGFGDPELWATDPRGCESWVPHGLTEAVSAMADRWGYSDNERAWALEQALQKPQEWRRLIEADLRERRWPGGEGGPP